MSSSSVMRFFALASTNPATLPLVNHRERLMCKGLGDVLVQSGIELRLRTRLQAGLITLVSPPPARQEFGRWDVLDLLTALTSPTPEMQIARPSDLLDHSEELHAPTPASERVVRRCAGCESVRCLVIAPVAPSVTAEHVKQALRDQGVEFTVVRPLKDGFEVSVEPSPEVVELLRTGLHLPSHWHARVRDSTMSRQFHMHRTRRAVCFLCQQPGHVQVMCVRQRPEKPLVHGG